MSKKDSKKLNTKFEQKKCTNPKVYFDSAATTLISKEAKQVFNSWISCFNPSSSSNFAKSARDMIDKIKSEIKKINKCPNYSIIFTSCASESNCFIIRSTVDAYTRKKQKIPHIITSEIEHHSIIDCVDQLLKDGKIQLTKIAPNIYGQISASNVEKAIKDNTALISIMYANNELGALSNIPAIGAIAHKHNIPMHSDCVQIYGKFRLDLPKHNIDACSVSAHKFHGPKGIGMLIINEEFIKGYELQSIINGTQEGGLRGGSYNVPAICSMMEAIRQTFINRDAKNKHMRSLINHMIKELTKHYNFIEYSDIMSYVNKNIKKDIDENKLIKDTGNNVQVGGGGDAGTEKEDKEDILAKEFVSKKFEKDEKYKICVVGTPITSESRIPNLVMISIIKNPSLKEPFCNVKFKQALDKQGVVVSISSACLSSSKNASHVLLSLKCPQIVLSGILRISLSDMTDKKEVDLGIKIFCKTLEGI
jgi:cysteine desulfurase